MPPRIQKLSLQFSVPSILRHWSIQAPSKNVENISYNFPPTESSVIKASKCRPEFFNFLLSRSFAIKVYKRRPKSPRMSNVRRNLPPIVKAFNCRPQSKAFVSIFHLLDRLSSNYLCNRRPNSSKMSVSTFPPPKMVLRRNRYSTIVRITAKISVMNSWFASKYLPSINPPDVLESAGRWRNEQISLELRKIRSSFFKMARILRLRPEL